MITMGAAMHSIIWVLLLAGPCVAFVASLAIRYSPRVGFPSIPFRLGKYGFWIVLAIVYVAMFATALIEHKI
jgi:hypothetical protein